MQTATRTVFASLVGCVLALSSVLGQTPPQDGASAPSGEPASKIPILVTSVMPVYPPIAAAARVEATVEARLTLSGDGRVADVAVTRSVPLLDRAVIDALRQWRFSPASRSPVNVRLRFFLHPMGREPLPNRADPERRRTSLSLVPPDFAFAYLYFCGNGFDEIHSTAAGEIGPFVVSDSRGLAQREVVLSPEAEQLFYLTLVERGFFAVSAVAVREPHSAIVRGPDGFDVAVVGGPPLFNPEDFLRDVKAAGVYTDKGTYHRLEIRQFGTWRRVIWTEPAATKDAEKRDLVTIGAAIRRMRAASDPTSGRDECR
jgi:protein TonB